MTCPRLLLAILSVAPAGCGAVVAPYPGDGAVGDAVTDSVGPPDVHPADAGEPRDASADVLQPDAMSTRPTSIVLVTNHSRYAGMSFVPRGNRPGGERPEFAGGCRLYAPHLFAGVGAGTVTVRGESRSQMFESGMTQPAFLGVNVVPGWNVGELVTVSATGSDAFPAFSVGCAMPAQLADVVSSPAGPTAPWNPTQPLSFRWTPIASEDLVRVSIFGSREGTSEYLVAECLGPISRGMLVVVPEALRALESYPYMRNVSVGRLRIGRVTVGDATIESWC